MAFSSRLLSKSKQLRKSAGRNSSGRITVFHRGGGSKRLQRRIDLKRSTSSVGIVERIEYDPNRSSRIASVRWIEGVPQRKCKIIEEFAPPRKILEPTTTTIRGLFSFSSPPGKVDQRKVACFSPGWMAAYVVVGLPTRMPPWSQSPFTGTSKGAGSKKTCAKDVFFSAFSSQKTKGETASLSFGSSFGFPRIAVAGAKPAFFAPRMRENLRGKNTFSLCEVRKWRERNSSLSQVLGSQSFLHPGHAIPVRHFAKDAARPVLKGDEMLKNIFLEVKKKFETAIDVFRKEKITIDPDDPAAVAQYAKVMKMAREKADLFSEAQRIKYTIQTRTQDIPDARTYLLTLKEIRIKRGLNDDLGAEAMMFDALEKIEKELKKPLMRNDKKGMSLLMAEFDKINQKLGIRREDLPKYEEQLDLKISKAQLEELKKDALEAMETQKKREEFKDEEMVDTKSLDVRNFL